MPFSREQNKRALRMGRRADVSYQAGKLAVRTRGVTSDQPEAGETGTRFI